MSAPALSPLSRRIPWPVLFPAAVLAVLLLAALAPQVLSTVDPQAMDFRQALRPPAPGHPFGTDQLGRDVYARTVHAARVSLAVGVGATAIGFLVGSVLGLLAAVLSRVVDAVLMRVVDILLAFPGLLLALVCIAVLGPGPVNSAVAIGVASVPQYARLVRAQAQVLRGSGFVEAARTLGQGRMTVALRHILPNALAPLTVLATLGVGTAIIAGAGLSFIGLGTAPPTPEWGAMLAEGRNLLGRAWWVVVFPGLCVTAAAICVTVLGRHWQAALEGRGRA
ncbi:ABC transporter permease [Goodfellowiella coeruleoviolacea]|uniref:Peptide/nickel transport system permease protein n=1 Tax=Goodfellowiella coeruleoviolacea TaxID=334858 RepID=A0AAE3GGE6_9PSEU|nr:ABC transporter permease [Goodfellowiella coeruleoviolacea]MCP2167792.1 peptide/nickel transport system permease protein [Goodfellowiella coeruleoviolacea]